MERVVELVDIVVVDVSSEGARVIHSRQQGEIDRACRRLSVVDEEDGRNRSRAREERDRHDAEEDGEDSDVEGASLFTNLVPKISDDDTDSR